MAMPFQKYDTDVGHEKMFRVVCKRTATFQKSAFLTKRKKKDLIEAGEEQT